MVSEHEKTLPTRSAKCSANEHALYEATTRTSASKFRVRHHCRAENAPSPIAGNVGQEPARPTRSRGRLETKSCDNRPMRIDRSRENVAVTSGRLHAIAGGADATRVKSARRELAHSGDARPPRLEPATPALARDDSRTRRTQFKRRSRPARTKENAPPSRGRSGKAASAQDWRAATADGASAFRRERTA